MASRSFVGDDSPSRATYLHMGAHWLWPLIAAAWAVAVIATLTGQRYLIDHHYLLEESGLAWPVAAAVFLACWQVMIAAMMLPSAVPALALLDAAGRHARRSLAELRVTFLAGFATPWTVFALLAFAGDTAIHRAVNAWSWLAAHAFLIGVTTLAGAGAYQLTPLKGRCLAACHDLRALCARYYRSESHSAWWLGVRHGAISVGCSCGLMLIMFGIGVGGLGWMAALTGAMLVEEAASGGQQTRLALGIVLLLLAALWLLRPAWLVPLGVS